MQENNELQAELKEFFAAPDEPQAPAPMGLEDWTQTPDGELKQDFKLSTTDIASIAYHATKMLDAAIVPDSWTIWQGLTPEMQNHYIGVVNFFMNSAANPNGHQVCQELHDLVLDAKLKDGWKYGESYSEADKIDPILLPYRTLPDHVKARNFLFRCVCVGLVALWRGH